MIYLKKNSCFYKTISAPYFSSLSYKNQLKLLINKNNLKCYAKDYNRLGFSKKKTLKSCGSRLIFNFSYLEDGNDIQTNYNFNEDLNQTILGNQEFFWNQCFDKSRLKNFVLWFVLNYGEEKTLELVQELKTLGFKYATKAGISLGIDDLKIPPKKADLIFEGEKVTLLTTTQYKRGEITGVERFQRLIDTWHRTSENLKQEVIDYFEKTDRLNPVYMMAFSGARGNISQVRQLVGMRGLMSNPQGQIIDYPIRSNFREGLTLTEYIISSYGARKGIVDTALRTANAGYLTRRLVDVAQHVIISNFDCKTNSGIFLTDMKEGNKVIYSLQNRLVGRILAETIGIPQSGSLSNQKKSGLKIIKRNTEISLDLSFNIAKTLKKVFVRSVLTCQNKKLVCQLCYGWSLAQGNLVAIGEAVGIIAAQSIGEPGTQLTMRTFHTGGVFAGGVTDQIQAPFDGIIEYGEAIPGKLIRTPEGKIAFLTTNEGFFKVKSNSVSKTNSVKRYKIPIYTLLFKRMGEKVFLNEVIAQISSLSNQKNATDDAELTIKSEMEGQLYGNGILVKMTGIGPKLRKDELKVTTEDEKKWIPFDPLFQASHWGDSWVLSGKIYNLPLASSFFPILGDFINRKTVLNQIKWKFHNEGFFPSTALEFYSNNENLLIESKKKNQFNFFKNSKSNNLKLTSLSSNSSSSFSKRSLIPSYFENQMQVSLEQRNNKKKEIYGTPALHKGGENYFLKKSNKFQLTQSENSLDLVPLSGIPIKNKLSSQFVQNIPSIKYSILAFNVKNIFYKKHGYLINIPSTLNPRLILAQQKKTNYSFARNLFSINQNFNSFNSKILSKNDILLLVSPLKQSSNSKNEYSFRKTFNSSKFNTNPTNQLFDRKMKSNSSRSYFSKNQLNSFLNISKSSSNWIPNFSFFLNWYPANFQIPMSGKISFENTSSIAPLKTILNKNATQQTNKMERKEKTKLKFYLNSNFLPIKKPRFFLLTKNLKKEFPQSSFLLNSTKTKKLKNQTNKTLIISQKEPNQFKFINQSKLEKVSSKINFKNKNDNSFNDQKVVSNLKITSKGFMEILSLEKENKYKVQLDLILETKNQEKFIKQTLENQINDSLSLLKTQRKIDSPISISFIKKEFIKKMQKQANKKNTVFKKTELKENLTIKFEQKEFNLDSKLEAINSNKNCQMDISLYELNSSTIGNNLTNKVSQKNLSEEDFTNQENFMKNQIFQTLDSTSVNFGVRWKNTYKYKLNGLNQNLNEVGTLPVGGQQLNPKINQLSLSKNRTKKRNFSNLENKFNINLISKKSKLYFWERTINLNPKRKLNYFNTIYKSWTKVLSKKKSSDLSINNSSFGRIFFIPQLFYEIPFCGPPYFSVLLNRKAKEIALLTKKSYPKENTLSVSSQTLNKEAKKSNFQKTSLTTFSDIESNPFSYQINRQGFVKFNYHHQKVVCHSISKNKETNLNNFVRNEISLNRKKSDLFDSLKTLPVDFYFIFKTIKNLIFWESTKKKKNLIQSKKKLNFEFSQFNLNFIEENPISINSMNLTKKKLFNLQKDIYTSVYKKTNNNLNKGKPKKLFSDSFKLTKKNKKVKILSLSRLLYFFNSENSQKLSNLKSFSKTINYMWILENKFNSISKTSVYEANSIFNFCVLSCIKSKNKKIWKISPKLNKNKFLKKFSKTNHSIHLNELNSNPPSGGESYSSVGSPFEILKTTLGWLSLRNILSNFIKFELKKNKYLSLSLKDNLIINNKKKNSKTYELFLNETNSLKVSNKNYLLDSLILNPKILFIKKKGLCSKNDIIQISKKNNVKAFNSSSEVLSNYPKIKLSKIILNISTPLLSSRFKDGTTPLNRLEGGEINQSINSKIQIQKNLIFLKKNLIKKILFNNKTKLISISSEKSTKKKVSLLSKSNPYFKTKLLKENLRNRTSAEGGALVCQGSEHERHFGWVYCSQNSNNKILNLEKLLLNDTPPSGSGLIKQSISENNFFKNKNSLTKILIRLKNNILFKKNLKNYIFPGQKVFDNLIFENQICSFEIIKNLDIICKADNDPVMRHNLSSLKMSFSKNKFTYKYSFHSFQIFNSISKPLESLNNKNSFKFKESSDWKWVFNSKSRYLPSRFLFDNALKENNGSYQYEKNTLSIKSDLFLIKKVQEYKKPDLLEYKNLLYNSSLKTKGINKTLFPLTLDKVNNLNQFFRKKSSLSKVLNSHNKKIMFTNQISMLKKLYYKISIKKLLNIKVKQSNLKPKKEPNKKRIKKELSTKLSLINSEFSKLSIVQFYYSFKKLNLILKKKIFFNKSYNSYGLKQSANLISSSKLRNKKPTQIGIDFNSNGSKFNPLNSMPTLSKFPSIDLEIVSNFKFYYSSGPLEFKKSKLSKTKFEGFNSSNYGTPRIGGDLVESKKFMGLTPRNSTPILYKKPKMHSVFLSYNFPMGLRNSFETDLYLFNYNKLNVTFNFQKFIGTKTLTSFLQTYINKLIFPIYRKTLNSQILTNSTNNKIKIAPPCGVNKTENFEEIKNGTFYKAEKSKLSKAKFEVPLLPQVTLGIPGKINSNKEISALIPQIFHAPCFSYNLIEKLDNRFMNDKNFLNILNKLDIKSKTGESDYFNLIKNKIEIKNQFFTTGQNQLSCSKKFLKEFHNQKENLGKNILGTTSSYSAYEGEVIYTKELIKLYKKQKQLKNPFNKPNSPKPWFTETNNKVLNLNLFQSSALILTKNDLVSVSLRKKSSVLNKTSKSKTSKSLDKEKILNNNEINANKKSDFSDDKPFLSHNTVVTDLDLLLEPSRIKKKQLSNNNSKTPTNRLSKYHLNNILKEIEIQAKNKTIYYLNDMIIKYKKTVRLKKNILGFESSDANYLLKKLVIGLPIQKTSLALGEFFKYGDKLENNLTILETGQIIHRNKEKVTLRKGQRIKLSINAILHKYHKDFVTPQSPVITLSYSQLKTGDIVQGIPKIEQFFEARTTKRGRLFRDSLPNLLQALFKYKMTHLTNDVAARESIYKIQQILIDGVQRVYRGQGVTIADKHLEVIVKQMTAKAKIIKGGCTGYLSGDIDELVFIETVYNQYPYELEYEPLILGISKTSLEVKSFLSAASFQHTTRILTKAAIYRETDYLSGLKENILLGNLIPAGTGYLVSTETQ